jgi:hypothetical protein
MKKNFFFTEWAAQQNNVPLTVTLTDLNKLGENEYSNSSSIPIYK